jgi:alpha-glucoside transport system permease protein
MVAVQTSAPGSNKPSDLIYRFLRNIPTWLLWFIVVLWTLPTFALLVNSFRTGDAQRASGFWNVITEGGLTMDNYTDVLATEVSGGVKRGIVNSLAIALPGTLLPIFFATCAAYAFAWIDFKGRKVLFIATVALLAIPLQVALVPLLQTFSGGAHWTIPWFDKTLTFFPSLDLAGTHVAVWLSHTAFGMPFAIFLLHNHIASLPRDLFEAARIDGADHFTIFWRLVLPLSMPVIAAFAIFQFLWTWNDYLVAVTMLGAEGNQYPATVMIANLAGQFGGREQLLTAGAFLQAFVPLVVFFSLQKYFVRGMLAGSVKG